MGFWVQSLNPDNFFFHIYPPKNKIPVSEKTDTGLYKDIICFYSMSLIRCSKSRVMVIFSIIFILQNNHYFYSVFASPTPIRHPEFKKSVLKSSFKQSGNESRLAPHVFEKSGDFTGSEGSSPITRTK